MTPESFIEKWKKNSRTEKSAAQEHFLDICELLEVQKPGEVDPEGEWFTFEKHININENKKGYVDVWRKNCFAWEYKRQYDNGEFNHKNLVKAFSQVREYAGALGNPPLLIVSDMKEIRVRTNFTNSISEQHVFQLADLNDPRVRQFLGRCFTNPDTLKPEITREGVTTKAAMALGVIAEKLRNKDYEPRRIAHFLNKIVFCLFAEDIDLLPNEVFADILEESQKSPEDFSSLLSDLFRAMKDKDGRFGMLKIPWFNGGLFDDDDVLPVGYFELRDLATIARLDWSAIEPAIFGTLFESSLNPDKRQEMANLFDTYGVSEKKPDALPGILDNPISDKGVGIHYTDPDTMMKIIRPVVLRPLELEWDQVKAEITRTKSKKAEAKSDSARTKLENQARDVYDQFRRRLSEFRVLDPACGSGNFLYLSLQVLKDFDLRVIREAIDLELPNKNQCIGPEAMLGIEINPYAAELARVTIWIGELQWQMKNAYGISRAPILGALDGIQNRDALMNPGGTESKWPVASVVVGNPPFVGDRKMKRVLGEEYTEKLRDLYQNRVSRGADLVVFWFEKARAKIERGELERAGLVSTNSIRGGSNRKVLEAILTSGTIFEAWSDERWVLDGAAVRVSLTAFGQQEDGERFGYSLDGKQVGKIYADLTGDTTSGPDLTKSETLLQNDAVSFIGSQKSGPFDIDGDIARRWLLLPSNPNGRPNSDVLRPWTNGSDIVRKPSGKWIIDFGSDMSFEAASMYEKPFQYLVEHVKPKREKEQKDWWIHWRSRPEMRAAIEGLERFICTPRVAKHRIFVWLDKAILPDSATVAVARDDDTSFGILHSKFHEMWALRMGTSLEDRPRYTPSSTFETYPFPEGLTPVQTPNSYEDDPRAIAIAEAAKKLDELRSNWLNPPELVSREPEVVPGYPDRIIPTGEKAEAELKKRTLTNLYNQRPSWLDNAHKNLDAAVARAYGWPEDISDEDAIEKLFELNQKRAAAEGATATDHEQEDASTVERGDILLEWQFQIPAPDELSQTEFKKIINQADAITKKTFKIHNTALNVKKFTIIASQGSVWITIAALVAVPATLLAATGAATHGVANLIGELQKTKGGAIILEGIFAKIAKKYDLIEPVNAAPMITIENAAEEYEERETRSPTKEDHNKLWERRSYEEIDGEFVRTSDRYSEKGEQ